MVWASFDECVWRIWKTDKRILDKITLEEKIGQLQQTGASLAEAF